MTTFTCTTSGVVSSEKVDQCAPSNETLGKEHTIESRLAGYEALAWKVIGGHGYPTTWDEFCEEFKNDSNHPDAVKIAHAIFLHTQVIRGQVKKGDAEGAALEALRLEHQATKLMAVSNG
jgi:hypothetical protein